MTRYACACGAKYERADLALICHTPGMYGDSTEVTQA